MRDLFHTLCGLVILAGLIALGMGVLIWLSPVTEDQLTPAQKHLVNLSDLMVKAALGGAAGFITGRALPSR